VVLEVDMDTFAAAHADGAFVIDVREPFEYADGHVPAARFLAGRGIDAWSVAGGTSEWVASGRLVVRGWQENVA
jgi:rhodanese-related sulfurtransferase